MRAARSTPGKSESGVAGGDEGTPAELIDAKIAGLGDWRGETLARMRALIREADPDVVEAVKWRKPTNPAGVPVWGHAGILCTGETYKDKVKLTFAKGAALDPVPPVASKHAEVRYLHIHEDDELDPARFADWVRQASRLPGERL